MDKKQLKINRIDLLSVDIENAKALIKDLETQLCYKQQEIEEVKIRIKKLQSVKENLEKDILSVDSPVEKVIKKRTYKRGL